MLLLLIQQMEAQWTNVMIYNSANPEEPSIAINPLNTLQMVAGANSDNAFYSSDGGVTWFTHFLSSTFGETGDPCLVADSLGNFF